MYCSFTVSLKLSLMSSFNSNLSSDEMSTFANLNVNLYLFSKSAQVSSFLLKNPMNFSVLSLIDDSLMGFESP